jgi:spermidine synthase
LEVSLYFNQFQLADKDALYSDGDRYLPAILAVNGLKQYLPDIKHVLTLGSGLASIVHVFDSKGYKPQFTLVEKDKVVLNWATELMPTGMAGRVVPICADAAVYMERNTEKFDLIFCDIFIGRVVPDFVITEQFFSQCKNSLNPGGHIAFNYLINNPKEWEKAEQVFASVFPNRKVQKSGMNRVIIGSANR